MAEDEDKAKDAIKSFEEKLESGDPILSMIMEMPLKFHFGEAGRMAVDFPGLGTPNGRAGTVRILIPPASAEALKKAIEHSQENPEMRTPISAKPTAH